MHTINDSIHWVGYIDWDLRNFHGYMTPVGSTYNAYLIMDEHPTLIDTVKHYGYDEMLDRIKAVIDPKEIRYIISNHTEMDHSGTIDALLELAPNAEVVCSPKGEEHLKLHFKKDWKFKVVNTGDTLTIGKRTLSFVMTPMVHWPDNMVTYSPEDKILFSNDAFGQHYASPERYVDEIGVDEIFREAAKYYANIVLPYGNQVVKALEALSGLELDMICPSHGLMWRTKEDVQRIVEAYTKWSHYEADNRVSIIYDSMWHSTEKMAHRLSSLLDEKNIPAKLINLEVTDISDIVTDMMFSKVCLFGTPMLNNRMLPTMAKLIMYVKGLKPKNRYAWTFGSYGWATVGFKELESSLAEAGLDLLGDGHYVRFIPGEQDLAPLKNVVETIAEKLS